SSASRSFVANRSSESGASTSGVESGWKDSDPNVKSGSPARRGIERGENGGKYDFASDLAALDRLIRNKKLTSKRRVVIRRAYANFTLMPREVLAALA